MNMSEFCKAIESLVRDSDSSQREAKLMRIKRRQGLFNAHANPQHSSIKTSCSQKMAMLNGKSNSI